MIRKRILSVVILCALMMSLVTGCESAGKDWNYIEQSGQIVITGYNGNDNEIKIPSVIDGKSVTGISDSAFTECKNLNSVIIPDSVTTIGKDAFFGGNYLTSITIPDSVTSIGDRAFGFCQMMTEINVSSGNPNYLSEDGILYSKDKTMIIACPAGKVGSIEIPDTVTNIVSMAFWGCTSLTSITIPESIETIGDYAFHGCTSLLSITISDGVTNIGNMAFEFCENITSITIPDSVTSIGVSVFRWCGALTEINVSSGNPNFSSEAGILYSKDKTAIIYCPEGKSESVVLPNEVIHIDDLAFSGCASLMSITIPNGVTSIGTSAFSNCTSLTSITIPDSVTSIEYRAFFGCYYLTSITIPDSVTSIDDEAFKFCYELVIRCREESFAHDYAVENEIEVSLVE